MEPKRKYVGASVIKKDAKALLSGKPLYTDDIAPKDCLVVKLLRSPHAHALIEEIDFSRALKVEGIEINPAPIKTVPRSVSPWQARSLPWTRALMTACCWTRESALWVTR